MNIEREEMIDKNNEKINIIATIDNQNLSLPIYNIKKHNLKFEKIEDYSAIVGEPISFNVKVSIEPNDDDIITDEDNKKIIGSSVIAILSNDSSDSIIEEDIIKNFIIDENNNVNVVFDELLEDGEYTITLTSNESKYFKTIPTYIKIKIGKNTVNIENLELCTLEEIQNNEQGIFIEQDTPLQIPSFEKRYLRFSIINGQNNPVQNVSMSVIVEDIEEDTPETPSLIPSIIEEQRITSYSDENGEVVLEVSLPTPSITEEENICEIIKTEYNMRIIFNEDNEDFFKKYTIENITEKQTNFIIKRELIQTSIGIKKFIQQKNKTKGSSLFQISGDIININNFDPVICGRINISETINGDPLSSGTVNEIGFYQINDIPIIIEEENQEESYIIPKNCSTEKETIISFNPIPDIEIGKHFKLSAKVVDKKTSEPIKYGMVTFYISNSEETLEQYPRFMVELNDDGIAETTVDNLEALIESTNDKNYFMAKYLGVFEYQNSFVKAEKEFKI